MCGSRSEISFGTQVFGCQSLNSPFGQSNVYGYTGGSPIDLKDPSGECPFCIVLLYYGAIYAEEIVAASIIAAEVGADVPNPVSSTASFGGRAAQELTHDVYLGYQAGKPAYVGITANIANRAKQWSGVYDLRKITSCPVTKDRARAIEQTLINANPQFNNVINSISPNCSSYQEGIDWGQQWLNNNPVEQLP